jgi:hypothetical protein
LEVQRFRATKAQRFFFEASKLLSLKKINPTGFKICRVCYLIEIINFINVNLKKETSENPFNPQNPWPKKKRQNLATFA